jgi:hypothetical protein
MLVLVLHKTDSKTKVVRGIMLRLARPYSPTCVLVLGAGCVQVNLSVLKGGGNSGSLLRQPTYHTRLIIRSGKWISYTATSPQQLDPCTETDAGAHTTIDSMRQALRGTPEAHSDKHSRKHQTAGHKECIPGTS